MPKRTAKQKPGPKDVNQLAKSIVDQVTGDTPPVATEDEPESAAVKRGRLGGNKGGKSRAAKLTAEQRMAIARKAAKARWGK